MRHSYAIQWAYGRVAVNNGARPDLLYRFDREEDRREWVAFGPRFMTDAGYRGRAYSSSPRVRRALADPQIRAALDAQGWAALP